MMSMQPEWKRSIRQTMLHISGLVLVFTLVPVSTQRWWMGGVVGFLTVVGSVPLTLKRVKAVSSSTAPYLEAALAILMMAAMVIVGFAAAYFALSKYHQEFPGLHTKLDAVYFTVTTF